MFFFLLHVLTAHYVCDFLLQTHWQAVNKSKNWNALTRHVFTYTAGMTVIVGSAARIISVGWPKAMAFPWWFVPAFAVITFATHFVTDAVTSRANSQLWEEGMKRQNLHWFFANVGADQLIHTWTLALTLYLLVQS